MQPPPAALEARQIRAELALVMSLGHGEDRFGATDLRFGQFALVQERDGVEGAGG